MLNYIREHRQDYTAVFWIEGVNQARLYPTLPTSLQSANRYGSRGSEGRGRGAYGQALVLQL